MSRKSKTELTEETITKIIEAEKPSSMTQLAHSMGYKGSVSSSLTKKFRALVPGIDAILSANKAAQDASGNSKKAVKQGKSSKGKVWPHSPKNPFRMGAYQICFDVLLAHPDGLPKAKLIELMAKATGKTIKLAGYDCQVLLSAWGNEAGLNPYEGPRHRSCRHGFYVERLENGLFKLVVAGEPQ